MDHKKPDAPPPLPIKRAVGPYCCAPWLSGRTPDGEYLLETDEYGIVMKPDDMRLWVNAMAAQLDADEAREKAANGG